MTKLILMIILIFKADMAHSELLGALGDTVITPRKGTPISGYAGGKRRILPWDIFGRYKYATYFKPHKGVHDDLRAKVAILKDEDKQLLLISIDVVGTIDHFKTHLLPHIEKYGFHKDNIVITSTHTHSGPGAITTNKLWQLFAMDRFHKKIYGKFMARLIKMIESTYQNLVPVKLYTDRFVVPGIQRNRAGKAGMYDPYSNVLYFKNKDNQQWLGGILNFAIHGTALGQKNRAYSADVIGSIEREMQKEFSLKNANQEPTVFMLLNGALGDVAPTASGLKGMKEMAMIFAQSAMESFSNHQEITPKWSFKKQSVNLGKVGLSVYNCSRNNFFGKLLKWTRVFKNRRWRLSRSLPKKIEVKQLELGPILLMFWPGEPLAEFGLELHDHFKDKFTYPWTVSLAENHLAYFVSKEAERRGTREACTSFYSYKATKRIVETHKDMQAQTTN